MENTELKKKIEEQIRKERKRKETRACKDKLFELSYKELKQK